MDGVGVPDDPGHDSRRVGGMTYGKSNPDLSAPYPVGPCSHFSWLERVASLAG